MFGVFPKFHSIPSSYIDRRAIAFHTRGCRALTIDKKTNTIYFASIDGLFKYSNGKTSEIKLSGKSIFANKLIFLFDQLWVGSVNEGLYVLQKEKIWKHYNHENLLHGDGVKSFKIVGEIVFVATEQGLTRLIVKRSNLNFLIIQMESYQKK